MSQHRVWIRTGSALTMLSGSALRKHVECGSAETSRNIKGSVVDPYWFQCGPGSSFLSQCGSRTDPDPSRKPNQCASRRIRILGQTFESQKVDFFHVKILNVGNAVGQKTYLRLRRYKSLFERQKTRFICKVWSISMLSDPNPHYQYGSGSKTAK